MKTDPPSSPFDNGLLAIGEVLIDALTNDFVRDLSEAKTLAIQAGGSPANLCRLVQRSGGTARLVAAVGKDGLGKILLKAIAEAGVSTDHVWQLDGHATSLVVVARSQGTPEFIAYRDADRHLPPVDEALIERAAVVHTTAFALSQPPARQTILNALGVAHARGVPVSVDWNYAEPVWGRENRAADVFRQILSYQPLLKVSLDDVARFTVAAMTPEAARHYLQTLPARVICLTCGLEGVWYKGPETEWHHAPAPPVNVKDTTGAGDAFWAGFLTHWMQQQPLADCVQNGIATAARRLEGKI